MPIKECNKQCDGCALKPGGAANNEVLNHLTVRLAVLGPYPFYCHDTLDWKDPESHKMSRQEFREKRMGLCTGWLEKVRELAATGYYRDNPMITKTLALLAKENLGYFLSETDPEEKDEARKVLSRCVESLGKKLRRFQGSTEI